MMVLFSTGYTGSPATPDLTRVIYDDALAPGWANWSWATVNLAATAHVHSGSRSISVTFGAWQGLYLHNAGADALGTTHLRFFIHGGGTGGQQMNVFLNLVVGGQDQNGPAVAVPPPAANVWSEVQVLLSTLNPGGDNITGITWQDSSGHSQPALYIDDIAFTSAESPDAPQLSGGYLFPRSAPADGATMLIVRVMVTDPQGSGDIASVTLDASRLGQGYVALRDDGRSNDGNAGDGVYGAVLAIDPVTSPGEQKLLLTAVDQAGHSANLSLGALNVLDVPGGAIPASLPQRIGWGSNAWSETLGQDWQVSSGVPWDYVYQYITYNWENWGPNFVYRFVHQAWDKQFIPMVTVYMVLGTPPDCGETSTCYAQKLQNGAFVQAYLASLQRAAQQAVGSHPVIFNLEPDFYGYMQQLSNDPNNRPPGVQPDNPASYPVALNQSGYANTLAGFGRYLVDLIHATAPNALVAPMASMWATNGDPQSVTAAEAMSMGQRTAAFIDAMGGAQADLLVVEWSDRDAGSGLRPWWDDQDQETPRPTRAILWENALSRAAHKRLFLWQMPVGNMSLDNTCDHYRDNRAAYAFSHPRDLVDAGVAGVLFGGGASCMTSVETDGGFVGAQGGIAYAAPAAPTGLAAGSPVGPVVPLRWNESTEPDLWGYRVVYQLESGGPQLTLGASRRNAIDLVLPTAGDWQVRLQAYDAMGRASTLTSPVTVTTTSGAKLIYLPILHR
jgi:hypothetical protein